MPRTCSAPYVVAVVAGSYLAAAGLVAAAVLHLYDRMRRA